MLAFVFVKNFYRPALLVGKLRIHFKRIRAQSSASSPPAPAKSVKTAPPLSYFSPPVNFSLSSPSSFMTSLRSYFIAPKIRLLHLVFQPLNLVFYLIHFP